ncbi:hypothetical protein PsYK624_082350 [Phanerochaete sordida]|uniref:Uncharacterized protein n=1 Tax=Phanerochaete sordida TaxID=48140 RepID=A0A9P3LFJ9_9APHY|nr:hypothetical protein PsYK624_082350 [Phanerochaete sordida]
MSLSTTATTTYTLAKYSRAYPAQTSGSHENDSEWQHFTNPVIRLILDLRKSARGELESYRLRILWSLNSGQDMMDIDQRDVSFEDLDLLSFSDSTTHNSTHGLPLKAVYRDAVVGIRYLYLSAGASPVHRRFQMNFQTAADATSFIEAVRHVCPCKANPPSQTTLARAATMTLGPTTSAAQPPASISAKMPPPPVPASASTRQPLRSSATMHSRPLSSVLVPVTSWDKRPGPPTATYPARPTLSSTIHPSPSGNTAVTAPPFSSGPTSTSDAPLPLSCSGDLISQAHLETSATSTITLNTVSQSCSSNQSASNIIAATRSQIPYVSTPQTPCVPVAIAETPPSPSPPTSLTAQALPKENIDAISKDMDMNVDLPTPFVLPPLPGSLALYDIPKADLEAVIAEVVREEGFVKLLESLDSLWRVKAFLGR